MMSGNGFIQNNHHIVVKGAVTHQRGKLIYHQETTPLMTAEGNFDDNTVLISPSADSSVATHRRSNVTRPGCVASSTSTLRRSSREGNHQHNDSQPESKYNRNSDDDNGDSSNNSQKERSLVKERWNSIIALSTSIVTLLLCAVALISFMVFGAVGRGGNNGSSFKHTAYDQLSASSKSTEDNNGKNRTSIFIPLDSSQQGHLYDEHGRYVLADYDSLPPFSDFLPALAGYYGKPLWVFFVNRGQGIASFGTESKEYPIMEYQPADKAYQMTAFSGFRTFLQLRSSSHSEKEFVVLEPFSPLKTRHPDMENDVGRATAGDTKQQQLPKRTMYIGANEMQIQEIDHKHGIETNATFFVLPEEDFGAFVKRTTITNMWRGSGLSHQKQTLTVSMLDGLAKIQPAGGKLNRFLKDMGRTLQGLMGVYFPYNDTIDMPFYRLSQRALDTADVVVQRAGHWCISILQDRTDKTRLLPIIYDPSKIFGDDTAMVFPTKLHSNHLVDIVKGPQYGAAKTASAFAAVDGIVLEPGESLTITTYFGRANSVWDVPVLSRRLSQTGFGLYKLSRSREIFQQITAVVACTTAVPMWDGHVQQMFLDNSLRGGIPSILGEVDDDAKLRNADEDPRLKVYHLFSRIHGDLERDYNDFVIMPTFFSEGPGSFRDIAQNRRNDVLFNPRIGAFNVKSFLSFIQADGYEPLSVEAVVFMIPSEETCLKIATRAVGPADGYRAQREALTKILCTGPFRPGQLFLLMEQQNIEILISRQEFIDMVAALADEMPTATYSRGFWADQWTYYMDLVQSYLAIYPDWEERIMFDYAEIPYFFSPTSVKPRREKYVLSTQFNGDGLHVRQLDAVRENDPAKVNHQRNYISNTTGWYSITAHWQHEATTGSIFKSSPIAKLFLLATLKFSTRDAYGMGIEYEAGHPGWNDANNGLPSMLGSGMPETFELKILLTYIRDCVSKYHRKIIIPQELSQLVDRINGALEVLQKSPYNVDDKKFFNNIVPGPFYRYWNSVTASKEIYREQTKVTFSGTTVIILPDELTSTIDRWLAEIDAGIARAMKFGTKGHGGNRFSGITPTYFSYNVTEWSVTGKVNKEGHPLVDAQELKVNCLPLFLEGPARMMKTAERSLAFDIYNEVRNSPLRDTELEMYTVSGSLEGQGVDIGRGSGFSAGWLENESVWLHMSYKFYLEMLRHGMFSQFFQEMVSGGMLPFMKADAYGRSLLECSSFLASSAFEDPSVRGRGFEARLSGATAEFLSMWVLMFLGPKPFHADNDTGALRFELIPALPRWLFLDDKNAMDNTKATNNTQCSDGSINPPRIVFKLFGSIDINYYHCRGNEDLFRIPPSRYVVGLRDGSIFHFSGRSIPQVMADKIRRVAFVDTIDVYFDSD